MENNTVYLNNMVHLDGSDGWDISQQPKPEKPVILNIAETVTNSNEARKI